MKKYICSLALALLIPLSAFSQQSFTVQKIEIEGLQNLDPLTVQSYLPIKRGQRFTAGKSAAIVKALYKTKFFDSISLSQRGNTLIIHVTERPTIGKLKISGNSLISTDKLTAALKGMDVAEGRVYDLSVFERIKKSLLNQYYQVGHYNARVSIDTVKMSRNRMSVNINISEGLTAKVKGITIMGNHVFPENTLLKQLDLTTTGLFTFFTQTDRYSEEKLDSSMEKLRNYYLDHGYLHFQVKSNQAEVTPDRKSIYVTIVVDEGEPFTVKNVSVSGKIPVPKEELTKLITFKSGETFSREKVIETEKAMSKLLGERGYMFSTILVRPTIDDATREVSIDLQVKPGKRAYVRHISFSNNNHTNDVALRRELTQMEAAPVSTTKLEESVHRLKLLPYIKDVNMSVNPVTDENDQVDVDYKVQEDSSAQATFKIGYSGLYGLLLGAGLNQKNFLGTGNALGINFQRSRFEQFYGMDYTDPYYTPDGISRTILFQISRTDPGNTENVNSDYTTNEYDFGMVFGIPIGQEEGAYNQIIAGAIYQNTLIKLITKGGISNQVNTFVTNHGRHFQELDLRIGYTRNSFDRAIFPTKGTKHSLFLDAFAPLDSNSLSFYILNYHGKWYQPITGDFIALSSADFGYGNGINGVKDYPFFRNFFAGGIGSVRGFQPLTLGPRDSTGSNGSAGKAYGGNMLIDGSIGLIFPNHISDNLRTSVFVDGGNVYSTTNNRNFGGSSTNSGPIRFSYGLEFDWLTPFGPIELVLAKPINNRKGDDTRLFDFAIGANF